MAPGTTPQLVSKQFSFTEGPAVDKEGNVFFTDQPNNRIWKYDTEGKLSVFMENAGRSNGMYFSRNGNLLTCADENNQLWSISPENQVTELVSDLQEGRVSRAQAYRWLKLHAQYSSVQDEPALAMRYKPLLRYALRPQGQKELYTTYQDLLNHEHPAWRYLNVWVQWGLYSLREGR